MTPQFRHGVGRFPIGEPFDHEQVDGSLRHMLIESCRFWSWLTRSVSRGGSNIHQQPPSAAR
jgi:hypothetical protein